VHFLRSGKVRNGTKIQKIISDRGFTKPPRMRGLQPAGLRLQASGFKLQAASFFYYFCRKNLSVGITG
jgi:hypothetical protein